MVDSHLSSLTDRSRACCRWPSSAYDGGKGKDQPLRHDRSAQMHEIPLSLWTAGGRMALSHRCYQLCRLVTLIDRHGDAFEVHKVSTPLPYLTRHFPYVCNRALWWKSLISCLSCSAARGDVVKASLIFDADFSANHPIPWLGTAP